MSGYLKINDINAYIKQLEILREANQNDKEYTDAIDIRIHIIKKLIQDLSEKT